MRLLPGLLLCSLAACGADAGLEDSFSFTCTQPATCPLTAHVTCAVDFGTVSEPFCLASECANGYWDDDLDFANGCEVAMQQGLVYDGGTGAGDADWSRSLRDSGSIEVHLHLSESDVRSMPLGLSVALDHQPWARYHVELNVPGQACAATSTGGCAEVDGVWGNCLEEASLTWDDHWPNADDGQDVVIKVVFDGIDESHPALDGARYMPSRYDGFDLYYGASSRWTTPTTCDLPSH